ncbi:actin cytoskeleton and mitosis protein, partial [Spiromyces aspiralis]
MLNDPDTLEQRRLRFQRSSKASLLDQASLRKNRAKHRKKLEQQAQWRRQRDGLAENTNVGTCELMCPEFEQLDREVNREIDRFEYKPGTREVDPQRMVKKFRRSDAGAETPLPEDIRTPDSLVRTMDYLVSEIVSKDPEMRECHLFLWDRTRAIRRDFTYQNILDMRMVSVFEKIARFHILARHLMMTREGERSREEFSEKQESDQLSNTLLSLMEFYDRLRVKGVRCPNEAEFRAYHLIVHMFDPMVKLRVEMLPKDVFMASILQQALRLSRLAQSNNDYARDWAATNYLSAPSFVPLFFREIESPNTPYLLGCVAEYHFSRVRRSWLYAMMRSTGFKSGKGYPLEQLVERLGFDDVERCREFCCEFSISVADGGKVEFGKALMVDAGEHGGASGSYMHFKEPVPFPTNWSNHRILDHKRSGMAFEMLITHGDINIEVLLRPKSGITGTFAVLTPLASATTPLASSTRPAFGERPDGM